LNAVSGCKEEEDKKHAEIDSCSDAECALTANPVTYETTEQCTPKGTKRQQGGDKGSVD